METKILNTGYEALLSGVIAAFIAQILKLVIDLMRNRKLNFKALTAPGGMPSSHSAGVMAITFSSGLIAGYDSLFFAIALGFSFVVMYDAAGVRRSAGRMSICLNKMMDDFYKHDVQAVGGKLKELLGHTPVEVYAGAFLGVIFAYMFHYFLMFV